MADDFEQALAAVIRRARERAELRQEDVSAEARSWGLAWTPATVAGIETGRRHVTAVELLLLPFLLRAQGEEPFALADLLADLGDVQLTRDSTTDGEALALIARGKPMEALDRGQWNTPGTRSFRTAMKIASQDLARRRRRYPKLSYKDLLTAEREAQGEAERNAGYRLDVSSEDVAIAARSLWGRSLTAERDARATPGASPQARGRITRQLLEELEPVLRGTRATR